MTHPVPSPLPRTAPAGNPAVAAPGGGPARVVALDRVRIEHALRRRSRYKYVQPRVVPGEIGWQVWSPNCSRNIDAAGGEIAIAWFEPEGDGFWRLHARDHDAGCWQPMAEALSLREALALVCSDEHRLYWP